MGIANRSTKQKTNIQGDNNIKLANIEDLFTYDLHENKVWYSANALIIKDFYTHNKQSQFGGSCNLFWQTVPSSNIQIHDPVPAAISSTMSTVLLANGVDISTDDEDINAKIQKILLFNEYMKKFQQGAEDESWSGHIAFKLVSDRQFSDLPMFQVYALDRFIIDKMYGLTTAITFIDFFQNGNYKLLSKYGRGFINYKLFKFDKNKQNPDGIWVEVELTSIDETFGLVNINFVDNEGNRLNTIFAVDKPNRVPNNLFANSPYGRSDYAGVKEQFHMIDEAMSSLNNLVRKAKTKTFISQDLLPTNQSGTKQSLNDYDLDYTLIGTTTEEDVLINTITPDMKTEPLKDTIDQLWQSILTKVGLSPVTVSIGTNLLSSNIARRTIQEAQAITEKTRANKVELWAPAIQQLVNKLLLFDDIVENAAQIVSEGIREIDFIVADDIMTNNELIEINVNFNDYITPSIDEKIEQMSAAVEGKVVDVATAVDEVWRDKYSKERKDEIVKNITGNIQN